MGGKAFFTGISILLLVFSLSSLADSDTIFEDWVTEGESFTVGGSTYVASAGVTSTSAILMGPGGVYVLDEGECRTIDKLTFCLEDFKYTIGGNVTIHGSDTQDFYITVSELGAELDIDRDIDNSNMMIGDTAKVTILIENSGEEGATGLYYEEIVPPEFMITNTYSLDQYGNKLSWHGGVPANSQKELSYNIKAKKKYSGQVEAKLKYPSGNTTKEIIDKLGFKANALFNLNFNADDFEIDVGEETRFYVTLNNNKESASTFELQITVPDSLQIMASHINDSTDSTLMWEDEIEADDEVSFTTAVKALSPGIAEIKATAVDRTDPLNPETKYFNITVLGSELQVYFIHGDILVNETSQIKVYLKNPSAYLSMTDIEVNFDCPFFNKTGSASEFKPKEYNQVLSAELAPQEAGSFTVKADVTYKIKGAVYTASKTETIEVRTGLEEEDADEEPEEEAGEANETLEEPQQNATENITQEPEEKKGIFRSIGSFFANIKDYLLAGILRKN